jgi:hypothetical protein
MIFVFFDMEEMTAVPLPPHPIIPIRIEEFAPVPNTVEGFKIVKAETAVALFRNDLRSIFLFLVYNIL